MESAEQLCLACGLCCDGTLFHHVQLGMADNPGQLKALGLPVKTPRARTPISRFPQPCAALCADRTCRVYANRPEQCRTFECGVLKKLQAGGITSAAALRLVRQARQDADKIRGLLRQLGDDEEHRSLNERFRRTKQRMEAGFADEATGDTFAELSLAMHYFGLLTHDKFYTRVDSSGKAI